MNRNSQKTRLFLASKISKLFLLCALVSLLFLLSGCDWLNFMHPAMSFKGEPQTRSWLDFSTRNKTLTNQAFIVGYSDNRGNPLWVVYRLQAVPKNTATLPRPSSFKIDKRVSNQVSSKDYERSGYDRGHMAPNYAISSLYGKTAQLETFLMSNITPQTPNLNRKFWQRLEEVEVKYFTRLADNVWVTTGPIFSDKPQYLKNNKQVQIPTAFYKLYAIETKPGQVYLLAFLVPQTVQGNEPLDAYLTTVDKVEELTGLDFFHELPDPQEQELESKVEAQVWQLSAVSRLPSRY